jgi:hypothetical protein
MPCPSGEDTYRLNHSFGVCRRGDSQVALWCDTVTPILAKKKSGRSCKGDRATDCGALLFKFRYREEAYGVRSKSPKTTNGLVTMGLLSVWGC